MADSAVRFFAPDPPQLARTLGAKLKKRGSEVAAEIAGGYCSDWAEYKSRLGLLQGFKEAIIICEETEKELNR